MAKKNRFFDFTKEGKGIKKDEAIKINSFGFGNFFVVYGRKFWNLSSLNFLYVIFNFPLFFALFAFSGNLNRAIDTPANIFYAQLYGMMLHNNSPIYQTLYSVIFSKASISVATTATMIFYALSLLLIITFGLSNAGMTYVLRGYTRGEPVYVLSDFWDTIKRNWKQAIALGIIDIALSIMSVNVFMFWKNQTGFFNDIMFYLSIFVLIVYFIMRFYMYIIMITFDLSIFKILKNSFIFALIGIKRNAVALIGIAAVVIFNIYLYLAFPTLGCIVPFVITISTVSLIGVYAAYPNIKKIMIDPYYPEEKEEPNDEEPVFKDRG